MFYHPNFTAPLICMQTLHLKQQNFLIVIKTLKKFGKEKISTNTNCNSWSVVFIFLNKNLRLNRDFIHFRYSMTDLFFDINDIYINLNDFNQFFVIAINSYYFFIKIIKLFFNLIYQFIIFCL